MRTKLLVAMMALVAILAIGCNKGSKMIGTWNTSLSSLGPAEVNFAQDGTMTTSGKDPRVGNVKITGKWKEDGDKVHITNEDITFESLPPALKPIESQVKEIAKKGMESGVEHIATIKFSGDDSFTVTSGPGAVATFTRKK